VARGDRTLDVLLLSGGGQHGAYGVGYLRGWASRSDAPMPRFDLVSGISTGALQAPFALLGTPAALDTITTLYRAAADRIAPTFDWWFWLRRTGGLVNTSRYERSLRNTLTPALQAQLSGCKAQVVLYPRTGSKLACFQIPPNLPPGELQRLIDLKVTRVESLRPGVLEEVHMDDKRYVASRWREALRLGAGVESEACFADGTPAVARQGRSRYLAGWFSAELQREVLERAARDAGLGTTRLPDAVRVRGRGDWLMAFNYGDTAHELGVPQGTWLLGSAVLAPHGVAIARRG
jgi:hypothetical protein